MSPADRARLERITSDALQGLSPVVVVNRRADTTLGLLDAAPSTPFPTIHDDALATTPVKLAQRAARTVVERARGIYGSGDDAGHTVYGSVRFIGTDDAQAGADAIAAALVAQGAAGVRAYGPVSLVASPDATKDRTTFAGDDTGSTLVRVHDQSQMPQVVADRLERLQGTDLAPDLTALMELPSDAARDAVRGWLTSSKLADTHGYIEAQVRRMTPQDVLTAVVDLRDSSGTARRAAVDPGSQPTLEQVSAINTLLGRVGATAHTISD